MPNQFLMDFMVARAARNNPAFAHQLMRSQEEASALKSAQALSKVLVEAIGANPTGPAQNIPTQLPQLPVERMIPSSYTGPFADEINQAAQQSGLSPFKIAAVARRESNFNPNAKSPTGPEGLMQLSKAAAQDVGIDPSQRFDPLTNLIGGAKYMAKMEQEFGDNAPAAYYAGPGAMRSGKVPEEAWKYQKMLQQDFANQQQPDAKQLQSPEYTDTSKFLPNPVSGGSGLLGQDMDSVRRAYFEHLKQVAQTGTPEAIAYVMKGLEDMRNAHMQDIQRTATQKELASTNLVPGSRQYSDAMLRTMMKPSTQINMGPGKAPTGYAWKDAGNGLELEAIPGGPEDQRTKPMTEAQGNAYLFGSRAAASQEILNKFDDDVSIDKKKLTIKHAVEQTPMLGEILGAAANPALSESEQMVDQARRDFINALLRRESGAAISASEFANANAQYFPMLGDEPGVIAQKRKNRELAIKGILETAGIRGKDIKVPEYKPKETPPLPELPAGHKWVD